MSEGPEQPQRYCTNCGAEIRPGIRFCVSCGAALSSTDTPDTPDDPPNFEDAQEETQSNEAGPRPGNGLTPADSTPSAAESTGSLADTIQESLGGWTGRFSGASSASGGTDARNIPDRAINWFRDLPSVPKLVIVGLVVLLLLTILSPLALVVAALMLGVSVIGLIVRVAQRESMRGWGIAAAISLVGLFVFGGISDVLYGTGFMMSNNSVSNRGVASEGYSDEANTDARYYPGSTPDTTPVDTTPYEVPGYLMVRNASEHTDDGVDVLWVFGNTPTLWEDEFLAAANEVGNAADAEGYDAASLIVTKLAVGAGGTPQAFDEYLECHAIYAFTPLGEEYMRTEGVKEDEYSWECSYDDPLYMH